ncbi:Aprataxin-like protein [Penicillium expansum]|nr:Aprataxin-like protein [Penicillium expansum]
MSGEHSNPSKGDPKEQTGTSEKRNAFTELLAPKSKQPKHATKTPSDRNAAKGRTAFGVRDGLGAYIAKPETYAPDVVIYHNDDFTKTRVHPFDAFEDAEFLEKVKTETRTLRKLAAGELRRKYGKDSAQEQARQAALSADPPPDELPQVETGNGRLWSGYSERLKHRKHYNSFSTPFFVPIEDFPLAQDDVRRNPTEEGYLKRDFTCWRCARGFGNRFAELKQHLEQEFKEWKKL